MRDTSGCYERRGVCLATGDAMAMAKGIETSNLIRHSPAMTATLHFHGPVRDA
jgi:hypothetical protein